MVYPAPLVARVTLCEVIKRKVKKLKHFKKDCIAYAKFLDTSTGKTLEGWSWNKVAQNNNHCKGCKHIKECHVYDNTVLMLEIKDYRK